MLSQLRDTQSCRQDDTVKSEDLIIYDGIPEPFILNDRPVLREMKKDVAEKNSSEGRKDHPHPPMRHPVAKECRIIEEFDE